MKLHEANKLEYEDENGQAVFIGVSRIVIHDFDDCLAPALSEESIVNLLVDLSQHWQSGPGRRIAEIGPHDSRAMFIPTVNYRQVSRILQAGNYTVQAEHVYRSIMAITCRINPSPHRAGHFVNKIDLFFHFDY